MRAVSERTCPTGCPTETSTYGWIDGTLQVDFLLGAVLTQCWFSKPLIFISQWSVKEYGKHAAKLLHNNSTAPVQLMVLLIVNDALKISDRKFISLVCVCVCAFLICPYTTTLTLCSFHKERYFFHQFARRTSSPILTRTVSWIPWANSNTDGCLLTSVKKLNT